MAAPLIAALAAPVAAEVAKEVVPIVAEEIRRMGSSFSQAPPTRAETRIPEVPPRLPPIRIRDISEDVRTALRALEELGQALKVLGLEAPREVGKRFGSDTTTLMDLALAEALHDTQTPEIQSKIRDVLDWVIKAEEKVCGSRVFVHGHESPDCRILGEVDWVLTQLHDDIRLGASPDYIAGRRLFHEGSIATDYKPKG